MNEELKNNDENVTDIKVDKIIIKDGFIAIKNETSLPFRYNEKYCNYTLTIDKTFQELINKHKLNNCILENVKIQYKSWEYNNKRYYKLLSFIEPKEIYYYTDIVMKNYTVSNNEIIVQDTYYKLLDDKDINTLEPIIHISKKMLDELVQGFHEEETKFKCVFKRNHEDNKDTILIYEIYPKTF